MKILKSGEISGICRKPVFMIVWCANCRHHVIIEEGDPTAPSEDRKSCSVNCPTCKKEGSFPLKTE